MARLDMARRVVFESKVGSKVFCQHQLDAY
jgi:hypothetical protein